MAEKQEPNLVADALGSAFLCIFAKEAEVEKSNFCCPDCGASISVDSRDVGRQVKCSKCSKTLIIPDLSVPDEPSSGSANESSDKSKERKTRKKIVFGNGSSDKSKKSKAWKGIIFGIVAFLLLGIAVFCVTKLIPGFREIALFNKESKKFVDEKFPELFRNWDKDVLQQLASPVFLEELKGLDLDQYCAQIREKMGKFKEYQGSKGRTWVQTSSVLGKVISAKYVIRAIFQCGPAEIRVVLVKRKDREWKIHGFDVHCSGVEQ